jgi:transcriptional regulator
MGTPKTAITNTPPDLLRGTVDLLILRVVANGPLHGYAIAQRLRVVSQDILQVGESALYPALQRLLLRDLVKSSWGVSENNRRARYYTITAAGRKHLAAERVEFERMLNAMARVMDQG